MTRGCRRAANAVDFGVPVSRALLRAGEGYVSVHVEMLRRGALTPPAAQFHLRLSAGEPRLVGIVH